MAGRLLRIGCLLMTLGVSATVIRAEDPPSPHIDKDRVIFDRIEDGSRVRSESQNPDEYAAYNYVLTFARQFSVAELESAARRDVTFRDLFNPVRKDFKLELVYFEGRLKRLRSIGPTRQLKEAGIDTLYEAWLFPKNQVNPICVLVTELPPGLTPQEDLKRDTMNVPVGVAGYSFKLMTYESTEPSAKDASRGKLRQAPLLMGRSFTVLPETGRNPSDDWYGTFLPGVIGVGGFIAAVCIGLALWYRRGDRGVKAVFEARRSENPFEA
jgi:hypothetical protein